MAIVDLLVTQAPETVFLFREVSGQEACPTGNGGVPAGFQEILHFQYWPQSLQDDYQVEYVEHQIPGGSHPLYQWVGGRGRTITFQAVFTSEINTKIDPTAAAAIPAALSPTDLLPSKPYTTDVAAALSQLRAWMRPEYCTGGADGLTKPPPRLTLCIPGTEFNGSGGNTMTVILRAAPITYEAWFPGGQPRIATVDLTLSEVIQVKGSESEPGSSVKFIGSSKFREHGQKYDFRSKVSAPFLGGSF